MALCRLTRRLRLGYYLRPRKPCSAGRVSIFAEVAELADAQDSKSCGPRGHGGSTPPFGTLSIGLTEPPFGMHPQIPVLCFSKGPAEKCYHLKEGGSVKQKDYNRHFPCSLAEGIDRLEFAERVSNEIIKMLHNPEANAPIGAINQWAEMIQTERLAFVNAGLECFYWIYIARNKEAPPSWENATVDQKVVTAAGFCSFILGIEFEDGDYDEVFNPESLPTGLVN